MSEIHPTALVHPAAVVAADAEVGPYAVIDDGVMLGPGARIGAFCHLYSGVELEAGVALSDGVILGHAPQDLKYRGEPTRVRIGPGSVLREYVTVNRATAATGCTRIGAKVLVMAYSHVAHDCVLEDGVIVANGVHMGGHVRIGSGAVVSGMTGLHQFVTVGPGVFIGGGLRVDKDVPPFCKALGEPLAWAGVNEIGLQKLGFGVEAAHFLKDFYRRLFAHLGQGGVTEADVESFLAAENGAVLPELGEPIRAFFREHRRALLVRRVAGR